MTPGSCSSSKRSCPSGKNRSRGSVLPVRRAKTTVGSQEAHSSFHECSCVIVAEYPTGDHWIIVGEVAHMHISPAEYPLVFFAGVFHTVH